MNKEILVLQTGLQRDRLYLGKLDGEFGPLTLAAVMQRAGKACPAYLRIAAAELGVAEIYGERDNPRIISYHATTTLKATDDEVPWCASFVNWCLAQVVVKGTNSAAAISYATWGSLGTGAVGDVYVMSRTGGNHVAFVLHMTKTHVWLLGGNQGNKVSITCVTRAKEKSIRRA